MIIFSPFSAYFFRYAPAGFSRAPYATCLPVSLCFACFRFAIAYAAARRALLRQMPF